MICWVFTLWLGFCLCLGTGLISSTFRNFHLFWNHFIQEILPQIHQFPHPMCVNHFEPLTTFDLSLNDWDCIFMFIFTQDHFAFNLLELITVPVEPTFGLDHFQHQAKILQEEILPEDSTGPCNHDEILLQSRLEFLAEIFTEVRPLGLGFKKIGLGLPINQLLEVVLFDISFLTFHMLSSRILWVGKLELFWVGIVF